MKNILIITGRYLPGYKDGGPVRTIKNLTDLLGDSYHFTVACADRDHGDEHPYDGIHISDGKEADRVNRVGKADVLYVKDGKFKFSFITNAASKSDIVYVCGPYNTYAIKALILNRFGFIKCPFVLAPMGSFSKGALAIKSTKKRVFFALAKTLKLFKNVYFSVTSSVEEKELKEALGITNRCFIAMDPQRAIDPDLKHNKFKKDDKLDVVFLSRICEKKNLKGAAKALCSVKGNVRFSIYGNLEDKDYYDECISVLKGLPENVTWEYKGTAKSEDVPKILSEYDVFLFPTRGENFGHVISEALSAGTIPVISDTTPWLDFNKYNAGYVIKHDEEERFADCIDNLCKMSEDELRTISNNAVAYYERCYTESVNNNGYLEMFNELL